MGAPPSDPDPGDSSAVAELPRPPERPARPGAAGAGARAGGRSARLIWLVLIGLAASVLVAAGARVGFPVSGEPPAWLLGGGRGLLLALYYAGVVLLVRVWLRLHARAEAGSGVVPVWVVWVAFAVWSVPLVAGEPLYSTDAFSYAAQGEMASRELDPYRYGPEVLGAGEHLAAVDPAWRSTPAPYGPLFVALIEGAAEVAGHRLDVTMLALRALAVAGVVLIGVFLPRVARQPGLWPPGTTARPSSAQVLVLGLLNPVTLLHLVADAHNESLLVALLLAGLAVVHGRRRLLGFALLGASAAVKLPAVLGLVFAGWNLAPHPAAWRRRFLGVLAAALAGAGVLAVFGLVTGLGWGWIEALSVPGSIRSPLAPATGLANLGDRAAGWVGIDVESKEALQVARALCLLAAAAATAWLLLRSPRLGTVPALGLALLVVAALAPVLHPWYLAWGLLVLAAAHGRWPRAVVIGAALAATLVSVPGGTNFFAQVSSLSWPAFSLGTTLVAAALLTPLPGWSPASPGGRRRPW